MHFCSQTHLNWRLPVSLTTFFFWPGKWQLLKNLLNLLFSLQQLALVAVDVVPGASPGIISAAQLMKTFE